MAKFIRLDYRLPNLITGKITKQSVMDAVCKGIPVDLIIDYLEQYAHKLMKQQEPILPINVVDQMRLWESENKRMKIEPAFMICLIPTDQEFDEFIQVVTGRNDDERATLLAANGAPDQIQSIIQNIDSFVNKNNQILSTKDKDKDKDKGDGDKNKNKDNDKEEKKKADDDADNDSMENNKPLKKLLDVTLPPLIMKLLSNMSEANEHTLKSRYSMTLQKYGWNSNQCIFTKNVNVNDMMKLSDDLCGIHLSKQDMINSSSKLLWSSKAEKTMVVTPKGRDVLKRHRSQKKSDSSLTPPNTKQNNTNNSGHSGYPPNINHNVRQQMNSMTIAPGGPPGPPGPPRPGPPPRPGAGAPPALPPALPPARPPPNR